MAKEKNNCRQFTYNIGKFSRDKVDIIHSQVERERGEPSNEGKREEEKNTHRR